MKKTKKRIRFCGRIIFVLYMVLALYVMFFSETLDRTMVSDEYRYNLTLFSEIERFWNMRNAYGWQTTIFNLLGNVVCFMPFGFLLPTISKQRFCKNVISVTLLTMLFSLFIETIQLVFKIGAFDVDDILLNTIGGLLGYIIFAISNGILKKAKK